MVHHDYCVYIYFRLSGVPAYVGYGRPTRPRVHLQRCGNQHLDNIIKQAGGVLPFVVVREGLGLTDAREVEVTLIAAIGREDLGAGPLVNRTDGGEGVANLAEESRLRIIAAHKGKKRSAITRAKLRAAKAVVLPSTREKMRAAKLGKRQSASHIENAAATRRGKKRSQLFRDNIRRQRTLKFADPVRGANHKAALCGIWINNGVKSRRIPIGSIVPDGFTFGRARADNVKVSLGITRYYSLPSRTRVRL